LLQAKRQTNAGGADASSLEAQRESLYTQIKELDMDHATGKVNDEDYAPMRAELVAQAAAVLKQLDGVATTSSTPTPATSPVAAQTDEVEAMIAARRKPRSPAAAKTADTTAEAAIAARRKTSVSSATSATCPKCGKPISADDAFCAKCGAALQPQTVR
jgi:hypothetical protein